MSSVTFSALSKKFDDFTAVDDLDLQIQDGEFCIFVGPSGCGKTTALRMLSGLEQPTGGSIHLGAHDITATPAKERNIAMVFQNYALYPHMTVAENMGFALRMQGAPKPEIRERVGNAATLLDIETLLDRYPRQLSGGQRQRVAVGRAIVRDPEVFLFDEPLSNLDAKLRNTARTELRDLQRRLGTTTVYVTHDQVEAMTMADRIVIMNKGRAEQIGPPLRVYDDPETAFVAGFLGSPSMNLIPLAEILRSVATQSDSPLATFLERFVTRDQDQLLLGFRPEHVILSHANDLPGIKLPVRIVQIEHLGAEAVIILDLQGCRLTARINERRMPKLGDTVTATIALDDLLLFEETSGRRIRPSARSVTPPRHTLAAS